MTHPNSLARRTMGRPRTPAKKPALVLRPMPDVFTFGDEVIHNGRLMVRPYQAKYLNGVYITKARLVYKLAEDGIYQWYEKQWRKVQGGDREWAEVLLTDGEAKHLSKRALLEISL